MGKPEIQEYIYLITKFIQGRITPKQFETAYLRLYTNDPANWPEDIYQVLNTLFYGVDAYCEDESIRDERDIDEKQLLESAVLALSKLKTIYGMK